MVANFARLLQALKVPTPHLFAAQRQFAELHDRRRDNQHQHHQCAESKRQPNP